MLIQLLLLTLTGALTGLFSGLFGVGGGIILVPMMIVFAIPIHRAISLSLVYVCLTGISGALAHSRTQPIILSAVGALVLGASLAVHAGTLAAGQLSEALLALLFAGLIGFILFLFFVKTWLHKCDQEQLKPDARLFPLAYVKLSLIGALSGWMAGLFGIGGGFLMVPMLVVILNFSMKQSVGISLASIVFISAVGIVQHYWHGALAPAIADYGLALVLMGGAGVVCARLGAQLSHRLPERQLRYGFIALTVLACVYMVFKAMLA